MSSEGSQLQGAPNLSVKGMRDLFSSSPAQASSNKTKRIEEIQTISIKDVKKSFENQSQEGSVEMNNKKDPIIRKRLNMDEIRTSLASTKVMPNEEKPSRTIPETCVKDVRKSFEGGQHSVKDNDQSNKTDRKCSKLNIAEIQSSLASKPESEYEREKPVRRMTVASIKDVRESFEAVKIDQQARKPSTADRKCGKLNIEEIRSSLTTKPVVPNEEKPTRRMSVIVSRTKESFQNDHSEQETLESWKEKKEKARQKRYSQYDHLTTEEAQKEIRKEEKRINREAELKMEKQYLDNVVAMVVVKDESGSSRTVKFPGVKEGIMGHAANLALTMHEFKTPEQLEAEQAAKESEATSNDDQSDTPDLEDDSCAVNTETDAQAEEKPRKIIDENRAKLANIMLGNPSV